MWEEGSVATRTNFQIKSGLVEVRLERGENWAGRCALVREGKLSSEMDEMRLRNRGAMRGRDDEDDDGD